MFGCCLYVVCALSFVVGVLVVARCCSSLRVVVCYCLWLFVVGLMTVVWLLFVCCVCVSSCVVGVLMVVCGYSLLRVVVCCGLLLVAVVCCSLFVVCCVSCCCCCLLLFDNVWC